MSEIKRFFINKTENGVLKKRLVIIGEQAQNENFKYKLSHFYNKISSYCRNVLQKCRRNFNVFSEAFRNFLKRFNYREICWDFVCWLFEIATEGATANFATHYLFGFTFNIFTMFAYGIVIWQTISILRRLAQNGPDNPIHDEESAHE